MTTTDLQGVIAAPFEIDVDRGKIREFARALMSTDAAYLEGREPLSPPTFLITSRIWQEPENSVWTGVDRDLRRVLHGEQEFLFYGEPPRAGSRLIARERIDSVFTKQGRRGGEMTFTVIVTEFRDENDRLVAESRMTQIATAEAPSEAS
jgi:hypothetical protein